MRFSKTSGAFLGLRVHSNVKFQNRSTAILVPLKTERIKKNGRVIRPLELNGEPNLRLFLLG